MHRAETKYAAPPATDAELITRYGSLIDRVARRLTARAGVTPSADELWSAGALGLLDAARRFDPALNARFETFAEHRVRGAMLDELRKMDTLPRRLRTQIRTVDKARSALRSTLERDPSTEEVAVAMGLEVEVLAELELLRQPALPIEGALSVASNDEGAEALMHRHRRSGQLTAAIATLNERLQMVLSLYYVEELTFREVAKLLQVSEARVCQLHADALGKLRALLEPSEPDGNNGVERVEASNGRPGSTSRPRTEP